MHNAPSVSFPVGRSRFRSALLWGAWVAGAAAIASWWLQAQPAPWRAAAGCASLLAAGAGAAWHGWRAPRGTLAWDGQSWAFAQAPLAAGPSVALDVQWFMLLRAAGQGRTQWFWVERAMQPQRWDDLRRAVYSRAGLQAPAEGQPPAARS